MIKLPKPAIEYFKAHIDEIFTSGNLAEGKWNKMVSSHVSAFCNAKNAIPTSSNGSGLVAIMLILKTYYNRTEVLIQSNTMYGVKTMVNSAGCNLKGYIDCTISTLMPSISQVKDAVARNPKNRNNLIILLSHIGGIINPDIIEIANYCQEEGIILLEDCAHSFGATIKGQHSGTFGTAGVYSFYATKSIPAGEGGVVITNDDNLGDLISRFIIYDRFKQIMNIGNNNRPSEIQALLIYSAILFTDENIHNKTQTAEKYIKVCNDLKYSYIVQTGQDFSGNYYKFILYDESKPISEIIPKLKTRTSNVYDYALGESKIIIDHHICLPIWYGQEDSLTEKVISELYESK